MELDNIFKQTIINYINKIDNIDINKDNIIKIYKLNNIIDNFINKSYNINFNLLDNHLYLLKIIYFLKFKNHYNGDNSINDINKHFFINNTSKIIIKKSKLGIYEDEEEEVDDNIKIDNVKIDVKKPDLGFEEDEEEVDDNIKIDNVKIDAKKPDLGIEEDQEEVDDVKKEVKKPDLGFEEDEEEIDDVKKEVKKPNLAIDEEEEVDDVKKEVKNPDLGFEEDEEEVDDVKKEVKKFKLGINEEEEEIDDVSSNNIRNEYEYYNEEEEVDDVKKEVKKFKLGINDEEEEVDDVKKEVKKFKLGINDEEEEVDEYFLIKARKEAEETRLKAKEEETAKNNIRKILTSFNSKIKNLYSINYIKNELESKYLNFNYAITNYEFKQIIINFINKPSEIYDLLFDSNFENIYSNYQDNKKILPNLKFEIDSIQYLDGNQTNFNIFIKGKIEDRCNLNSIYIKLKNFYDLIKNDKTYDIFKQLKILNNEIDIIQFPDRKNKHHNFSSTIEIDKYIILSYIYNTIEKGHIHYAIEQIHELINSIIDDIKKKEDDRIKAENLETDRIKAETQRNIEILGKINISINNVKQINTEINKIIENIKAEKAIIDEIKSETITKTKKKDKKDNSDRVRIKDTIRDKISLYKEKVSNLIIVANIEGEKINIENKTYDELKKEEKILNDENKTNLNKLNGEIINAKSLIANAKKAKEEADIIINNIELYYDMTKIYGADNTINILNLLIDIKIKKGDYFNSLVYNKQINKFIAETDFKTYDIDIIKLDNIIKKDEYTTNIQQFNDLIFKDIFKSIYNTFSRKINNINYYTGIIYLLNIININPP